MQSKITIQATRNQDIETKTDVLTAANFKPLKMAKMEEFTLNEGRVFVQSICHYLAYIEMFDCLSTQPTSIDFTVNTPAFFMYADLHTGYACLCHQPAGKYRKAVAAGHSQIMLLTFRSDWLIHKCKKTAELNPFISLFCNPEGQPMHLPRVRIASSLFRSLIKMDTLVDDINMDNDGYIFINNCINKYYNKLRSRNATVHYHHHKAAEISAFIKTNFATEEAENQTKLAARFMISERSLARLAKIAFRMPLHEQVIKLRVHYAFDLLLTTEKPISEIATLSGYKEPFYFSKAFKKHFGASPRSVARPSRKALQLEL
jgi:AraC-like DNA-binding protein